MRSQLGSVAFKQAAAAAAAAATAATAAPADPDQTPEEFSDHAKGKCHTKGHGRLRLRAKREKAHDQRDVPM